MPARAAYRTYKVVKGDTLAAIAKRFASTIPEIAAASGVADPNKIKVGQVLSIPVASTYDPAALDAGEVKLSPGVTLLPKGAAPAPPPQSGEQAMIATVNELADWLRPPKLWVTLALAAGAGYYLFVDQTRRRR